MLFRWCIDTKRRGVVYIDYGKGEEKERQENKRPRTRLILPGEEMPEEDEIDENEGGMFLEKGDVQLIYNALKEYKPTEEEENLHSVLLEEFEEILVVDHGEQFPDAN